MVKACWIALVLVGLVIVANLLYALKMALGIDLDPHAHHGNLFPLGRALYRTFRP